MANTKIISSDWYSLASAESNINAIADAKIRADATEVANILHSIDNSSIGIAYHLAEIATKIHGKEYEKFCMKYFGIKKAQAFNYATAGRYVVRIADYDRKKSIYMDTFTLSIIQKNPKVKNDDGSYNWPEYLKAVKKARSFGMTQILNISACISKTTLETDDVIDLIESGAISPDLSVKRITEYLMGKFKAIEQTTDKDNDKDKDKDKDNDNDNENSNENSNENDNENDNKNDNENGNTVEIPVVMLNKVYPELCRYSEDAPEISRLVEYLKSKGITG